MLVLKFKSITDLMTAFPDEDSCLDHLENIRWKDGITSPFDPESKVYKCKNHRYKCKNTGKYFNVKTNTVEGFWSMIKRGIIGVYHYTSRKHLQKYVDEFVFRRNTRQMAPNDVFHYFLSNTNYRTTYKELIAA